MIDKVITLQNGSKLEISMEKEFLEYVMKYYNLPDICHITSNHVKNFIFRATNDAIIKAEQTQIRAAC